MGIVFDIYFIKKNNKIVKLRHFRLLPTIYLLGFKFRSLKIRINMKRFNLWSRLLNITSSYTPLDSIFFLNTSFIFRYFLSSFPAYPCLKFLFSFPFNNMLFSSLPSILFLFRLYGPSFYINQISCLLKKKRSYFYLLSLQSIHSLLCLFALFHFFFLILFFL